MAGRPGNPIADNPIQRQSARQIRSIGAVFVGLFGWIATGPQSLGQTYGGVMRLSTGGLATPLAIPQDPLRRRITRIQLEGELPPNGDGKGTVTLEESDFVFNDFGDFTLTRHASNPPHEVTLRRIETPDNPNPLPLADLINPGRDLRRLYEIVFDDGSFPQVIYLGLSKGDCGPHRLLLYDVDNPDGERAERYLAYRLELQGKPTVKDLLPDRPLGDQFELETLTSVPARHERLHLIRLQRSPKAASLTFDRNNIEFNALGDPISLTAMRFAPSAATLKRVDTTDPSDRNRKLYDVYLNQADLTYRLVLAPTEAGPHRLLVLQNGNLQHVLPLYDGRRRNHLALHRQFADAATAEKHTILKLWEAIGYNYWFRVEGKYVVELRVHGPEDATAIYDELVGLKNLRRLSIACMRLRAQDVVHISRLKKLESLSLQSVNFDDAAMASLAHLTQLKSLRLSQCESVSNDGLVFLRDLTQLRSLSISVDESSSSGGHWSDSSLRYLDGLGELRSLDLFGAYFTDWGLEHVAKLKKLEKLGLSSNRISDAGLTDLYGLKNLQHLSLQCPSVTQEGLAALKAELPRLRLND